MNRKLWLSLVIVVVLAVIVAVTRPWETDGRDVLQESKPLVIGALLPQTGAGAVFADYIKKGIDIAVSEANAGGQTVVRVIYADSKNDPKEGVSAFRQMVLTESPPVVITALSSVTRAVGPLAKELNTVVVGTAVGLPDVTAPSEFVFRVYPEASGLAGVIAKHAIEHCDSAAAVYIDDDFGASGARVFEETYEQGGGRFLLKEPYKIAEADFRTQWTKIDAANPDCVWVTGYGPAYSVIVRQMKELNVSSTLLADMTLGLPITLKNVGPAAEGVVYVDGPLDPAFADRFRTAYGEAPTSYAGYAYDIVKMLLSAADANGKEPQAIQEALSTVRDFPGVMGTISMLPNRDAALSFKLMKVVEGQPAPYSAN
jgi:branched-chain amino acid transport system substrate-binding protein